MLFRSIEGRDHYALFYISKRADAFGTVDQHGGLNTLNPSYKLDKIELYARSDENTPVKTVHFEYDYSLCPQVDNNDQGNINKKGETVSSGSAENVNLLRGKLTLKRLYFTYKSSAKGRFNSYHFNYSAFNPKYNLKGYDRWGNFKPNVLAEETPFNCAALSYTWPLTNSDFPYVDQDRFGPEMHDGKYKADVYAQAWHLTDIELPSGGTIHVDYEADDYAYVQDKAATQMAKLIGFCDYDEAKMNDHNTEISLGDLDYNQALYDQEDPHECILFKLPSQLAGSDADFVNQKLKNGFGEYLYYNCLLNLTGDNDPEKNYEYVRGYTGIEGSGIINTADGLVGWVKTTLKAGNHHHPVSVSGWQYARMYLPHLVYPGSNLRKKSDGSDVSMAFIKGLVGFIPDAIEMIEGINNKLRRKNFAKSVLADKSWIRIPSVTGKKLGGGSRVKRLLLKDNWEQNSGSGANMQYGQEYSYTIKETINGFTTINSSGVASYEPTVGSDENVWKQPVVYDKENIGVPDDEYYSEEPFGEAYFPAPSVGYSRVEVKNLVPGDAAVNARGTGKVVHLYYTAKDFPVITKRTDLEARSYETSALFSIIGFKAEQDMTMSQGFQVELNDMHGKPKATLNYEQKDLNSYDDADAFSGVKYNYKLNSPRNPASGLSNLFNVVDKDNNIREATVGLESEMVMDTRQMESKTYSGGIGINLEVYMIPSLPPVPVTGLFYWPDFTSEFTKYKSAVLLRVINRFGLLQSTEAFEEGSRVKTENLLLDAETGETLLTATHNEYNDPVFNFSMPAHWVNDGMGQAYKNTGAKIKLIAGSTRPQFTTHAQYTGATPADFFADGDALALEYGSTSVKAHVRLHNGKWFLIDPNGAVIDLRYSTGLATVIQSGRKNMQSVPVMQVSSLQQPTASNHISFTGKEVLNASATTFSDAWRMQNEQTLGFHGTVKQFKEIIEILNFAITSGQLNNTFANDPLQESFVLSTSCSTCTGSAVVTSSSIANLFANLHGSPDIRIGKYAYFPSLTLTIKPAHVSSGPVFDFISPSTELGSLLNFYPGSTTRKIPKNIEIIDFFSKPTDIYPYANCMVTYDSAGTERKILTQFTCHITTAPACSDLTGYSVNPFTSGTKGAWRKEKDLVFYAGRTQAGGINLRKDGTFTQFVPYWDRIGARWDINDEAAGFHNWTAVNEVTKYSPKGPELENKDALGRFSAAIYSDHFVNLPLAVATNARYTQIGTENLEDKITPTYADCNRKNLDFKESARVSSEYAHTGKNSYKLTPSQPLSVTYGLEAEKAIEELDNGQAGTAIDQNSYNGLFNPLPGKYVLGAWVKVTGYDKVASYHSGSNSAHLEVKLSGLTLSTVTMFPKGQIIDGWQRIEGEFTIDALSHNVIELSLKPDLVTGKVTYFDDIRVHPYDAKMKTFAYDNKTQLLMAELDENNYATFYEYNSEGKLVRVKKETEKGILTLKEVRSNQRKISPTP